MNHTLIAKPQWQFSGTDLGIRRSKSGIDPDDLASKYSLKVPVSFLSNPDEARYTLSSTFSSLAESTQSMTVVGKFAFGAGTKEAFFGMGLRYIEGSSYYEVLVNTDGTTSEVQVYKKDPSGSRTQVASADISSYLPAYDHTQPLVIRSFVENTGASNVRITVELSLDRVSWVRPISHVEVVSAQRDLTGTWCFFAGTGAAHVSAPEDFVYLDSVYMSNDPS